MVAFEAAGLLAGAVLVVVELVTVVEFPLAAVLVVLVVFVVDVLLAFDVAFAFAFAFAGLLAALFAGAASPQAIPRALRPRTVESTITFFIKTSLLSSAKLSLLESFKKTVFLQPSLLISQAFSEQAIILGIGNGIVNPKFGKNHEKIKFFYASFLAFFA